MKKNITHIMFFISIAATCLLGHVAFADTVSVSNSVHTEANTGGSEGKGTASVHVKTIVNGEVVEDYAETKTAKQGEDVSIVYESTHKNNESSGVTVEAQIRSEASATDEFVGSDSDQDQFDVIHDVEDREIEDGMIEDEEEMNVEDDTEVGFMNRITTFFKTYVFWWI